MMPCSGVSGLPITWFFAIVVLTLRPSTIPLATLPVIRFPTTVALRAAITSITNAVLSPFPLILKPRIVKPETLTSLTRCPVSLPVLMFTSPRTQIASGPKVFEQGESALAGGLITASSSPRSLMPSLLIATSSWCTPRTTIVSPGWAAFMAFWMDSPGPTTKLCAATEPTPTASATPLATNKVRAMVANNTMVRLIKRPPLSVEGRRKKGVRPPPRYVTKAAYSCLRGVYVRHGTKYDRAPRNLRTSQNAQNANFAFHDFCEVRRVGVLGRSHSPGPLGSETSSRQAQ